MSALANFSNSDFQSLTIWTNDQGKEFFRAIDVCANLRHANPGQALQRHVDSEYVIKIDDGSNRGGLVNYLSEPGLYQLIFASRTEWAKKFQKWVFEEVLPKLRAVGTYSAPTASDRQTPSLVDILKDRVAFLTEQLATETNPNKIKQYYSAINALKKDIPLTRIEAANKKDQILIEKIIKALIKYPGITAGEIKQLYRGAKSRVDIDKINSAIQQLISDEIIFVETKGRRKSLYLNS